MGTIGAVVVPLLFSALEAKAQAGAIAGRLFIWSSELSLGCALVVLLCAGWSRFKPRTSATHSEAKRQVNSEAMKDTNALEQEPFLQDSRAYRLEMLGSGLVLVCSLGMLFVIIPHIQSAERRALWHGLGSAVFAVQWFFSAVLLLEDAKRCFARRPQTKEH